MGELPPHNAEHKKKLSEKHVSDSFFFAQNERGKCATASAWKDGGMLPQRQHDAQKN